MQRQMIAAFLGKKFVFLFHSSIESVPCIYGFSGHFVQSVCNATFLFYVDLPCLQISLQIEQGIPLLSKWIIFNRLKFVASKGVKLGPAFLLTRWMIYFA